MPIFIYICIFIFLAQVLHYWPHVTDDAFIFFRYADHFAEGEGLRWNLDGKAVEGFSSPLWVLILGGLQWIHLDMIVGAKLLGMMSILSTWGLMLYIFYQEACRDFLPILVFLCLGNLYYWSLSGMETGLYTFLLLGSACALQYRWCAIFLPLMALARPEGFFILIVMSFTWWIYSRKSRTDLIWIWIIPLSYFIFRIGYYHDVLPNTYYAKVGAPLLSRISTGGPYTLTVLLSLIPCYWGVRKSINPIVLGLGIVLLLELILVLLGGGDWMNWGRLLIPMFPIVFVLLMIGSKNHRYLLITLLLFVPFLTPWKAWLAIGKGKTLPIAGFQEGSLYQSSQTIAMDIQKHLPKGGVIAINHAGFLPYYLPKHHFVDMTGLNDWYIAHEVTGGLHQKHDADYVLSHKPDLIVFNSLLKPTQKNLNLQYWEGETALLEHQNFQSHYKPTPGFYERIRYGGGKAYIVLFYRKTD